MGWNGDRENSMIKAISYQAFLEKTSFSQAELLAYAWGNLVENPPEEGFGLLPAPPMLMFDSVYGICHQGKRGKIVAEKKINLDDWYFQCHFRGDPVMPGCLGVDAVWQLIGFYTVLRGAKGAGRALGSKEIEFSGQVRPHNKVIRYEIDIRRFVDMPKQGAAMTIGNALVFVDDELIYEIKDAKVGVFKEILYKNYPLADKNAMGGKMG